jgi:hypothetical protein
MPDLHLLSARYELLELRGGVAVLRNCETGQQIEQPLSVDLNDGVVRVESTATSTVDPAASR